jgi:hypothetical protein
VANDYQFTLSLAATDLLWEQLRLGTPPAMLELPSVGETMDDRARLREIVLADLTRRNLAARGQPHAEVAEAMATLMRFTHAIEGVVVAEDQPVLVYRGASNGRSAVLATKQEQLVVFEVFRPEELIEAVLGLIGNARPGPGRSLSYPDPDQPSAPTLRPAGGRHARHEWPGADEDEVGGVLQPVRVQATNYGLQQRSAQEILGQPRTRSGWCTALGPDRSGQEMTQQFSWFDTIDGRYLAHRRPGPDGQPWATCVPADAGRVRQQLAEIVRVVTGG